MNGCPSPTTYHYDIRTDNRQGTAAHRGGMLPGKRVTGYISGGKTGSPGHRRRTDERTHCITKSNHMRLIQSFLLSVTRVKLTLYEQRILTKIVEAAQGNLGGMTAQQLKTARNPYTNIELEVPMRYILSDNTKDYAKVLTACRALMHRQFEFYNPQTRTYYADTVIHNVRHTRGSGKVQFMVSKILLDVLYDFSIGYKAYDLETALQLPTPYAVRMYILLNEQERPITWSIVKLKEMFGVADKYTQTRDFIKKVIEPARNALNTARVNSFTYNRNTVEGGKKVESLTFFPVKQHQVVDMEWDMPMMTQEVKVNYIALRTYMRETIGFTLKEINIHAKLLQKFARVPPCVQELQIIYNRAQKKGMQKGYIINAIRGEIEEWQDVRKTLPRKIKNELKRNGL